MKKIQVRIKKESDELNIEMYQGQNLLEVLQKYYVDIANVCQGNGSCGKCKIKTLSGNLPVTEADKRRLSEDEVKKGIRLACKINMEEVSKVNAGETLKIEIIGKSEEEIVVQGISEKKESKTNQNNIVDERYFIAIDIGTTTVAMALVNERTGKVCDTYSCLNHQRKFGADVISRIKAANEGKTRELKQLIETDLWNGIQKLTKAEEKKITKIIIAGNTTMIHLLMGYSCETLGKHPFSSDHLSQKKCVLKKCIAMSQSSLYEDIPVTILTGISVFVGADITADIIACLGFETEEVSLLIDLGTNGEMVLGNRDRLYVTSTAAGPAFEGGNIICGCASIPGAVSRVKIQNQRAVIKTIKDKMSPVGICGTGLVSAIAQLKLNKLMDEQGKLRFPYDERGFTLWTDKNGERIALYQQDIREFQVAKAAIRAGIEILMEKYGCQAGEVKHIYLAGGFGNGLSVEDAIETGILPVEFHQKAEGIGNGVLLGAIEYGNQKKKRISDILNQKVESVDLAKTEEFQEKYIRYMNFDV